MSNPYQSPAPVETRSFWSRFRRGFNLAMRAYRDGTRRDGIVGFRAFQAWFVLACVLLLLQTLVVAISVDLVVPFIRGF